MSNLELTLDLKPSNILVDETGKAKIMDLGVANLDISAEVYRQVLSSVDQQLIQRALDASGGRIREAARRLGLARNTLKAKMQKYGMSARE